MRGSNGFWGGIDSQRILPFGSPEEIRQEVHRMFDLMGRNGGYVLTSVHNIQPDVPPENVLALFRQVRNADNPVHSLQA
ncbi:MAG: uroporphyrinogen decarboxylase family protein [Terriglobia bacterium]